LKTQELNKNGITWRMWEGGRAHCVARRATNRYFKSNTSIDSRIQFSAAGLGAGYIPARRWRWSSTEKVIPAGSGVLALTKAHGLHYKAQQCCYTLKQITG
jgi:hypothetical protein